MIINENSRGSPHTQCDCLLLVRLNPRFGLLALDIFFEAIDVQAEHCGIGVEQHAREAALAAEAASLQNRFWEMHDLLYREQSVWSKAQDVRVLFNAYAGMLGLNIDRFRKDMESEQAKARVKSDEHQAAALGLANTPTIFINDRRVPPARLNPSGLRIAINAATNEKASK